MTVEAIKTSLAVKGCTIFLIDLNIDNLEVVASYGLSDAYLNKGPISALKSIAQSLEDGPVAIYDVLDDVNFVQAMANMVGMAIEISRQNKGMKDSIDVLKTLRNSYTLKSRRRTSNEGVPVSFPPPMT